MFRQALLTVATLAALAPAAHADYVYYAPAYAPPPRVVAIRSAPRADWWYLSVGLVGTTVVDSGTAMGGGFDLGLGFNLSPNFALELGAFQSFHGHDGFDDGSNTFGLLAFTVDAKVRLLRGPIEPYVQAGVGAYTDINVMNDIPNGAGAGPGFQVGGGVDFWLSRRVTLGLRALYRGVGSSLAEGDFVHVVTSEGNIAFHF